MTLQSQSGVTQGNNVAVSEKGNNFAALPERDNSATV